MPPKIALVLGGGATRGFAHVGIFKGEALRNSVNRATQNRPLEKLNRVIAADVSSKPRYGKTRDCRAIGVCRT